MHDVSTPAAVRIPADWSGTVPGDPTATRRAWDLEVCRGTLEAVLAGDVIDADSAIDGVARILWHGPLRKHLLAYQLRKITTGRCAGNDPDAIIRYVLAKLDVLEVRS